MQKYFTKEISQSLKVIVLGLAIGLGVSFVSANWTAPTDGAAPNCAINQNPPHPGCDAPVNIGQGVQAKAGPNVPTATLYIHNIFGADNVVAVKSLNVGGIGSAFNLPDNMANIYGRLTIDRSAKSGADGRDMFELRASPDNREVIIRLNKSWLTLWDTNGNGSHASLLADNGEFDGTVKVGSLLSANPSGQTSILEVKNGSRTGMDVEQGYSANEVVRTTFNGKVRIQDGTQADGKVFTSSADGLGSWKTPVAEYTPGGKIQMAVYGSASDNGVSGPNISGARASCPPNTILISGGGSCNRYRAGAGAAQSLYPTMIQSRGDFVGQTNGVWIVSCTAPTAAIDYYAYAQAICISIQ